MRCNAISAVSYPQRNYAKRNVSFEGRNDVDPTKSEGGSDMTHICYGGPHRGVIWSKELTVTGSFYMTVFPESIMAHLIQS